MPAGCGRRALPKPGSRTRRTTRDLRRQGSVPDSCRARACRRAAEPSFCASPAATCGRAARRTAPPPSAGSATRTSSGRTAGRWQVLDRGRLADHVAAMWGHVQEQRLVVVTGGEPMLQLDDALVVGASRSRLSSGHRDQWHACRDAARRLDLRQSEGGADVVQQSGNELKLVWPQAGIDPGLLETLAVRALPRPADGLPGPAARRSTPRSRWRWSGRAGGCRCRPTRSWASPEVYSAVLLVAAAEELAGGVFAGFGVFAFAAGVAGLWAGALLASDVSLLTPRSV